VNIAGRAEHSIAQRDKEAGFGRLAAATDQSAGYHIWRDGVSARVSGGLTREPLHLPRILLQRHWHLNPASAGVARVHEPSHMPEDKQSVQIFCTLC
jgi:hypothetical protein